MLKLFSVIIFLSALVFSDISAVAQTVENSAPQIEEKIHYGDLIDIDVIGSTEYDWRGSVNPEGFLSGLDFVEEPIFALCLSETELARQVEKGYAKLLREPKVTVKILDRSARPLSMIYGAIKTPQRLRIERPAKLNELIILSGGFTEYASGEIQILRPKQLSCEGANKTSQIPNEEQSPNERKRFISARTEGGSTIINIRVTDLLAGKPEANPEITGGDIITVLEAEPIYIIGGVVRPSRISSRSQMTVSRAVSSAGGVSKDADEKKTTVFRRNGNNSEIFEVNLAEIRNGKAEDLPLKAFDIVEVSQRGREKRKIPPVIKTSDFSVNVGKELPLRIINR